MRRPPFSLLAAVVLLSAVAVERRALLDDLAELVPARTVGPRLSVSPDHRACSREIPLDGTIPVMRCHAGSPAPAAARAVSRLWIRTRRELHTSDAGALHTAGLLRLLWSESGSASASGSLFSLHGAHTLAALPSRVLGDISAAYLIRAGQTQNARDLQEAVASAEQALRLEPENPVARFNMALALDWIGLNGQARDAWAQYLAVDSTSGWAKEAQNRMRALAVDSGPPVPPGSGASTAEIHAYAARWPQEARLHGWDRVLGDWGEAVLDGDTARAAETLREAQVFGDALGRNGGDATLAEAVHAIRARSQEPAATRALAQGHLEYAKGQAAYHSVDYNRALARFARVLEIRPPSPQLMNWAGLFHAAMLPLNRSVEAEQALLPLTVADTLRYPALVGRARWARGTVLLRRGRYDVALQAAEDGSRLLGRLGETEHQGGAQYVAADAQYYLGATFAAHAAAHRALTTLRPYRRSIWLLNALALGARTAETEGLSQAAIRFQDERVAIAHRIAVPARVAEARMGRARMLAAAGMPARAWADIQASQPLLDSVPEGTPRTWLETELHLARADYFAASQINGAAAANLDSVLAVEGFLIAPRRLRAHVGRAAARLALGDTSGATADLVTASLLLVQERDSIANTEYRASLIETARGVFDRLAMLRLAERDTLGALLYLERGRTSFGPTKRRTVAAADELPRTLPGEVAVAYALVGDTLLTWTVAGASVRLVRQTVDRRSLIGAVEDLRSSLERGEDARSLRPALAALYDRLVAPVEARLGDGNTTLVVVADGELGSVPFSALYDRRRGRYLVEAHPLRYAGSLRDAARTRAGRASPEPTALLIADPAFDRRLHPGLARLPGARREVASIAATYPAHAVLTDSGASRGALQTALTGTSVIHFAGHAVFDDQRPERSYLVLATEPEAADRGWLTAGEMEGLPLRQVNLFVLSACQTLRSRSGRAGGFAGFAGALLDAGAGGVVGSLWQVDDGLTAPLMVEFHRAYRRSGDGPRALREAQLRLLQSSNSSLRSPAAWAGFRYAGN